MLLFAFIPALTSSVSSPGGDNGAAPSVKGVAEDYGKTELEVNQRKLPNYLVNGSPLHQSLLLILALLIK